ncbi:hypothetical protein QTJ16_005693 [Diplocarpon rosae]|uniref:KOW domain-containing protein n=1 Tax=Diplocarpon rosae TaxID=946125 RepID=A0AAD9WDV5_9HELO|nr:hypothetical protein QTJ16_005693 [Diplocarpon rosae]PBP25040.1 KOW domain-containing protein domain-containing protein [Diplocarpon rosae]
MQKVFRRTIMAEKQVARRLAKKKDKYQRQLWRTENEQNQVHRADEIKTLKTARAVRREDYELGPLAPRRDVGDEVETYGTISMQRAQGRTLHGKEISDILEFWGGAKNINIVKGDRVVILHGRDKGKIGFVTRVDVKRAEASVKGLNMIDIAIPAYMISKEDPDKRPIRTIEQPVSLKYLRLVHTIRDPETGELRDVIVKKVERQPFNHRRHLIAPRFRRPLRIIPGIAKPIYWPRTAKATEEEYVNDTRRMEVEAKTFVPTLLTPPMPGSVIDELRNRYSIFRTRHEPEYIEKKEKEEQEKEERKKTIKKMRTPLNEANRKARKERKKLGKGKLTEDMLLKIGEVIARKRGLLLDAADVSKEATPIAA